MKIFRYFLFLGLATSARAQTLMTDLIDVPTADVVDHYGAGISFRFYSDGGLLAKTAFGVFPRLNVGFGLDTEKFIGSRATDLNRPTLNVKWRIFDGQRSLPALALGYDGQGYFFNTSTDKYIQREKGLFLAASGEILVPDLTLHGGINIYDFTHDHLYGFTGLNYLIQDRLGLTVEWDNVRTGRLSRLNAGGRFYVTPSFSVDVAGRDLGAAGRPTERIVRLNYVGSF
jgi:hypothetical protein